MLTEMMIEKSSREFVELENQFGAHNYHPLDIVIEGAEGGGSTTSRVSATWTASPPTRP